MNIPFALHHVGVAVPDVAEASANYVKRFGYEPKSAVIHDSVQGAFVQFLKLRGEPTLLEFIAPDGPSSRLNHTLEKGGGIHHFCYSTRDISEACDHLRRSGLALVRAPVSAVAFSGRRIAWLMGRDRILVELVEEGPGGDL